MMTQHHIPIEGTNNVRDLGGYPTRDGNLTRRGVYLRADNLDTVPAAGQAKLLDHGVRHIIDLRTTTETQRWPDVFAHSPVVSYHHRPFFDDDARSDEVDILDDVVEMYKLFVERYQPEIRLILETIGAVGEGAVLFHCAGGKDRTGIIAALLLGLAGVDGETIAQDYALTAELTAARRVVWRARAEADGQDMARYDRLSIARPEYMLGTIAHLRQTYGGIPGYVRAIGVDAATIEALRSRLVKN